MINIELYRIFYTVAIKIPALMYVIVTIFSQAWGISTVKETENSNDSKFYSNVFKIYTFLTFFVCIMLVSIIKPFMSIYVNPNYFLAWQYTPLLLIGNAFLAVSDFFGAFYNALKMPIKNMIVSAVAAFVSVLISVSTIHYIGLWGAALSTLLAYFVIMWVRLVDIKKYIEVKINWATFIINQIILITHAGLISLGYNILLVSVISIVCFILINFKLLTSTLSKLRGHKAS